MHQTLELGKPFTLKVPNGLKRNIKITLAGFRHPIVSVVNGDIKRPDIVLNSAPQDGEYSGYLQFQEGTPINKTVTLQADEIGAFFDPKDEQRMKEAILFRDSIQESYNDLFVEFPVSKALTFDSSAWTRSIGQIELAKKLERKTGNALYKDFGLFSGCGFGAIQACHFAGGGDSGILAKWWITTFKKSLKGAIGAVLTGDTRRSYKSASKAIRKLFRDNLGNDMLLKDLHGEIFLPLMDINGKALSITKKKYPMMPVYEAVALAALDPTEFKSKAVLDGYAIISSVTEKNPDTFIRVSNQSLHITSIGCPARVVNHGKKRVNREMLAIIENDRHNAITLLRQAKGNINRVRLECHPIDQYRKFDFSTKAIKAAINSAFEVG